MGLINKLRERLASASKLTQTPSSNSKTTRPWITPGKTTTAETNVERPLISKNREHPALEEDHKYLEPSSLLTDLTTQNGPDTPRDSRSLWKQAYDKLREEESGLVLDFQTLAAQEVQRQNQPPRLLGDPAQDQDPTHHDVQRLCQDGKQRMEDAEIRFKLRNKDHKVGEIFDKGIRVIAWGKDLVSTALGKTASFEVSIVWAATILVLPLLENVQKAKEMNDSGFIYVTGTLKYFLALEPEFRKSHGSCSQELVDAAEESIVELYKAILSFQLLSALRFNRRKLKNKFRDAFDYDGWETMLQRVKDGETFHNHAESTREMAATLQRLESRALSLEEQEHLQVLRPHDNSQDLSYESAKERTENRVPGTCNWLLEEEKYQDWLRKAHGLLMVSADPGCGKSVLAKHLIDERLLEDAYEATICYFFFKEDDQDRLPLALCALLHQLLSRKPSLIKRHLAHEHAKNGNSLQNNTTVLWSILEASLRDSDTGPVIIVLDGLDECRQADFQVLARSVNHLLAAKKHSHATTRWLFTTRPYQNITNTIVAPCIRVFGEEKSTTIRQEVKMVIQYKVRDPKLQRIIPKTLLSRLEERLLSVENPTYLWAALTFSFVETSHFKKTIKGLEDAIENLPRSINDAYSKILSRTDESLQPIIRKAFTIILGAAAPLTIAEMNVAMNLDEGVNNLDDLDMEDEQAFKRSLREISGLFIITHNDRVYFLHQTVREFFQCSDTKMPTANLSTQWQHSFSPKLSNSFMARICLRYNWLYNNDPHLPSYEINGYHVSKHLVCQTVYKMTGYRVGDTIQDVDDWIEKTPSHGFPSLCNHQHNKTLGRKLWRGRLGSHLGRGCASPSHSAAGQHRMLQWARPHGALFGWNSSHATVTAQEWCKSSPPYGQRDRTADMVCCSTRQIWLLGLSTFKGEKSGCEARHVEDRARNGALGLPTTARHGIGLNTLGRRRQRSQ
ncbi:ankyrin repeat-containing protein [Verticillium alfalfae VaMs.102]|uniref:Ankyrin repeat-containing protein n=1 Tax=Verticillium alfalfae (strain VaMs.102 / ATCC MYA-4576 / FGSC 10136) TaxID=526221 RepID=C9SF59_VERA1|nr:ankyrin repeat-containing protein [Verticillium alfalfae VaMs.102]EEY17845.1 ankyrin repeat-containing protein [Verticillium alfalfae VaMs.102]